MPQEIFTSFTDRQTDAHLESGYPPAQSAHLDSNQQNQHNSTYCTTLPSICYSPLMLPLVSHFSSPVHAVLGPRRDFHTPYYRSRHSSLLDNPTIPRVTKRAEIQPLSNEAFLTKFHRILCVKLFLDWHSHRGTSVRFESFLVKFLFFSGSVVSTEWQNLGP